MKTKKSVIKKSKDFVDNRNEGPIQINNQLVDQYSEVKYQITHVINK